MKILVCGSRTFGDYKRLESILSNLVSSGGIISGGANGADKLAEVYAGSTTDDNVIHIWY